MSCANKCQYDEELLRFDRDEYVDPVSGFARRLEPCDIRAIVITKVLRCEGAKVWRCEGVE